jgi:hypothetical protein
MSLDLTIRQKLVRVVSSAAVCGLSVSFMVGELVDYKAGELTSWKRDSRLIPSGYLPTRPIAATLQALSADKFRDTLVAVNSHDFPAAQPPGPVFQDSLRNILAAPAAEPPPNARQKIAKRSTAPAKKIASAAPLETIESGRVEEVLQSIHDATAKLSAAPAPDAAVVPEGGIVVKALPDQADGSSTRQAGEEVILPVTPRRPTAAARAPADTGPAVTASGWVIHGKVIPDSPLGRGHFEVGLFAKIDQDGIPVGFPLVQQILPAGATDFQLRVPAGINRGFLYGEYVAGRSGARTWIAPPVNPWVRGQREMAELRFQQADTVTAVAAATRGPGAQAGLAAAAVTRASWKIQGNVSTLFAKETIAQEDVIVKVRGRREATRTDKSGAFSLELPRMKGNVYLEFLKSGYHPVIIAAPAGNDLSIKVDLASREAIEQVARRLGLRQLSSKGVFLGKAVSAEGVPIKGMTLQMSAGADGPFYFGEDGFPSAQHKATTGDGRFLFFNVEPGAGFVEPALSGEAIAPFLFSTVEGGELVMKTLTPESGSISGRLFNPVSERGKLIPISGARVRAEGAAEWATTDSYGAFNLGPLKWIKGEKISLEFSAERFNNHRYLMSPDQQGSALSLFAFPATYIGRLAKSMEVELDSGMGIVFGKISQLKVRVDALADHSVANSARDYYFDAGGKLRGSHAMTDPRFGTYVIFNVPRGRTLLHGNDAAGVLRYSEAVITSPASISIIMD